MNYASRKVAAVWLVIVIGWTGTTRADGDAGYAGAYLKVPIGARPAAMGGAYLAISDDGAGLLYNPAGLANLTVSMATASYRAMQLDRTLGFVGCAFPVRGEAAIGASWLYAASGSVAARDDIGVPLGHEIKFTNHSIGIAFAKRFEKYLSLGAKFNYLHATGPEISAFTVGIDVGAIFHVGYLFDRDRRDEMAVQDIQLAAVVKHLGAQYNWNSENYVRRYVGANVFGSNQDDAVPIEIGLGGSARFLQRKLVLAADVVGNNKQSPAFFTGGEYFFKPEVAARAGFSNGSLTAGAGVIVVLSGKPVAIDYAFSAAKVDEGSEHLFSFEIRF